MGACYRLFELTLTADFPIAGLEPFAGAAHWPDVVVKQSPVPETLDRVCFEDKVSKVGGGEWLVDARPFGNVRLLIRGGHQVLYQTCGRVDQDWLAQLVTGYVMGAIQYQRGRLPLHGNCLIYNNKTILLCGHSGAGKSTASLALLLQGARLIADDLTPLEFTEPDGVVRALAGLPRLKLWRDSCDRFDIPHDGLPRVAGQRDKVFYPAEAPIAESAGKVDRIYCLLPDPNVGVPRLERLSGADKLRWLQAHLYKASLPQLQRNWPVTFARLSAVAKQCDVYLLRRPVCTFDVTSLLECFAS